MSRLEPLIFLSKKGNINYLFATRSKNHFKHAHDFNLILLPLRYVPLISPVMFLIANIFFLPIFILKNKPDFIILQPDISIISSIFVKLLQKAQNFKLILDVRTTPVEISGIRGFLKKFWYSVSVLIAKKHFEGITTITHPMSHEVCNDFNIDPKKIGVWTSAVNTELFNKTEYFNESLVLKNKLKLDGKFVVFYHGAFSDNRGLKETIAAIELSVDLNPDIVLFLLGDGPSVFSLKKMVSEKSLENNVIIHEPVKHDVVPLFIYFADVCIVPLPDHPYWRCQSPLKLLEYLAMEKPVILTDIPAHRNIVKNKKCGIYISSINPMDIANAIKYSYGNKENLVNWGKIGRTLVDEEYTWNKVISDLENYLESLK